MPASALRATPVLALGLVWSQSWLLSLGEPAAARVLHAVGVIPAVLTGRGTLHPDLAWLPPPVTLLSALFVHASVAALALTLLGLWLFAPRVETALGWRRFLLCFCTCGVCGGLAQALATPAAVAPIGGAEGAVAGLLGAQLLLAPRGRLVLLPGRRPCRLPLLVAGGGWLLLVTFVATVPRWPACAAGLLVGAILVLFLKLPAVRFFANDGPG